MALPFPSKVFWIPFLVFMLSTTRSTPSILFLLQQASANWPHHHGMNLCCGDERITSIVRGHDIRKPGGATIGLQELNATQANSLSGKSMRFLRLRGGLGDDILPREDRRSATQNVDQETCSCCNIEFRRISAVWSQLLGSTPCQKSCLLPLH